jgi:hypothetical protein
LAPANYDERPIGDAMISDDRYDLYLADKGYSSLAWERRWLEVYGALVAATPKANSRRAWPEADRRWASGKRQIIEQVISQLKDLFALERHRSKTLGGLLARLAEGGGLHVRTAAQLFARSAVTSPRGPLDLTSCASAVLAGEGQSVKVSLL